MILSNVDRAMPDAIGLFCLAGNGRSRLAESRNNWAWNSYCLPIYYGSVKRIGGIAGVLWCELHMSHCDMVQVESEGR